jgi:hypothetical protein
MAYSYPIWNTVEACIYGGSKSWGARDKCNVNVNVGSSATYSNHFVEHTTTKKEIEKDIFEFRFYVDGVLIKRAIFNKKDKSFKFIKIVEVA